MSVFKAYDIRGIYPSQIDKELAYKIGRGFVTFIGAKEVVVGHDARLSSPELSTSLIKGITDQGADVVDIGMVTTPMFNFVHAHIGYETGIMVTASHNPKEYNGFKMNRQGAEPLTGESGIQDIKELVEKNEFVAVDKKGRVHKKKHLQDYTSFVSELVRKDLRKDIEKLRVVVDVSNGVAGNTCTEVFRKLNISHFPLNFDPDGNFPNHDPNPLKGNSQEQTRQMVKEQEADLGCIFDADADRIIFVDDKGNTIIPDIVAALISKRVLKNNKGEKIIYDCISSKIIPKTIKDNGGIPIVTRVGRSYIYQSAKKEDVIFGLEASSHYYYREVYHSDNGLLTLLRMMELIVEEGKPISEIAKPFYKYSQSGEINLEVDDKDGKIEEIAETFSDYDISRLDGIEVDTGDVWFTVRKSNTEPVLRIRIEAETEELVENMKEKLLLMLQK